VLAAFDELQDSVLPVGLEDVEVEDVVLAGAPAWPIPGRIPAAWGAHDPANLMVTNGPGNDWTPQPIDQLAEAVTTAHMLSSLSEDSASSSSRQSA